ncbi:hypothetical protein [Ruminiclostridium cellobioparum]|uniref:Uncharacterized protein n=1 Tax=Ruminiclostridium cellobioparum subsp. termitidis CT1112 TaxID=1195236 RepID=S0FNW2_RUMCE|nr:hypothetical protein [Ruminiclostridium cellobioparum]EMS72061.1 hypothetical protein CTER_2046 [Ruminiclostridium cellobioparum subsp. termitidis CT1112]
MFFNNVKYRVNPICELREYLEDYEIVNISIGADNDYYILVVNNVPPRIDGMFPQTQTTTCQNYKVIILKWDNVFTINIDNQKWNYHFVQPIGNDMLLLVCARSKYYGQNRYDLNGKIFDTSGVLINEFLLGDGIQDLKVTEKNIIWTSYFDEGVFGNYGWDNPVGACGLRAWNQEGKPEYSYNNSGDNFICDCYALNVVNDKEVWFYYYDEFLLGRSIGGHIDYYNPNLSGADGFLVYDKYVLFRGGYNNRDEYHLLEFVKGDKLKEKKIINLINEKNETIIANNIDCRGSRLLLRVETKLYYADLKDIVNIY